MAAESENAVRALKRLHSIEKTILRRLQCPEKMHLLQCLADEEHLLMKEKGFEQWLRWWKEMLRALYAKMQEKDKKLRRLGELNAAYTQWIEKRLQYYDLLLLEEERNKLKKNNDYKKLLELCNDFSMLWEGLLTEFGIARNHQCVHHHHACHCH